MNGIEKSVCSYLADNQAAMIDLLKILVSIDSPSRDAAGVSAVIKQIDAFLQARGLKTTSYFHENYGRCLRAEHMPESASYVALMGHCDTVFPNGEAARRPFRIAGQRAYGPGVADMKGGLVLNAFVLAALSANRCDHVPTVGLFTADEEIASPWSRSIISQTTEHALAVLNSEPGRPNGNIVSARKGGCFFRIEIDGKAAHSGTSFEAGISAVTEVAHKIIALNGLCDSAQGITANAGAVCGGRTFNIVAEKAFIEAEVRYRHFCDREKLLESIRQIVSTSTVCGSVARLNLHGEFPPMEDSQSHDLLALYCASAVDAGFETTGEFSGGCSDAGFTASRGIPTLCGVGPVGGAAHTENEYVEIDSLVPRAQALALTIMRAGKINVSA